MIVVSDTSPLNYLVLIERVQLLQVLFGRVIVPPAVMAELQHAGAPAVVRAWAGSPPPWLEIQPPAGMEPLLGLGTGEAQAGVLKTAQSRSVFRDRDWLRFRFVFGLLDRPRDVGPAQRIRSIPRTIGTPPTPAC